MWGQQGMEREVRRSRILWELWLSVFFKGAANSGTLDGFVKSPK